MSDTSAASKPTAKELLEQLTGYDEMEISARFGGEVYDLLDVSSVKFLRALVFADTAHQGKTADEAYKAAMTLTAKDVNDYFSADADDAMPDEPDTESGKDDSGAVETPKSKPLGA